MANKPKGKGKGKAQRGNQRNGGGNQRNGNGGGNQRNGNGGGNGGGNYQTRDNSGTFFQNDKKERPEQPDYNGKVMIEGVLYWMSGWKKRGQNSNRPYLSLAFTPVQDREERGNRGRQNESRQGRNRNDDDIPF